jgi:hypothetical protein
MLSSEQASIVKGMLARGDKQHDIAAHFGENGGRIAEIAKGLKFSDIKPAPSTKLPSPHAPRFINPNDPIEKQIETLILLCKNPPENSRVITFSPTLAEWLRDNRVGTGNRKEKPVRIRRYAEAMEREEWLLTGETIIFGKSGLLLDGQNRILACIRAGKNFRSHVVFGIDETVFVAMNSGKSRTPSDTFKTGGIEHAGIVAPAVRWLMIYASGTPDNRGVTFSNQEMFDYYKEKVDPEQLEVAISRALQAIKVIPLGTLAAHFYLFERKHAPTARRLATDFAKGQRGPLKLSNIFRELRKQNLGRVHETWRNALLVKMWNAYRSGESITKRTLSWSDGQEYPTIA